MCIASQLLAELREQIRAGMDKHNTDVTAQDIAVEAHGGVEEVVHGGDSLDAGESPAGDEHGQQRRSRVARALEIRLLQVLNELVAQMDRVTERFHRHRPLGESRDAVEVGDGAEREDEVVVGQFVVMVSAVVRHRDASRGEVDLLDGADEEPRALQQLAQGVHDVDDVEIARRDLVQHRGEEKEVLAAHERHLDRRRSSQQPLELTCGRQAAETATENDNASGSGRHAITDMCAIRDARSRVFLQGNIDATFSRVS